MLYAIAGFVVVLVWLGWEVSNAPLMPDDYEGIDPSMIGRDGRLRPVESLTYPALDLNDEESGV